MESLTYDLERTTVPELNQFLHKPASELEGQAVTVIAPNGAHNLAVGVDAPVRVTIAGHAGYYAGGMNQHATIEIDGSAGTGVAENMMSGKVHVKGFASNGAGASAHGGLLVIDGDAGDALGDSLYEAVLYVRGEVKSLGADAQYEPMTQADLDAVRSLLAAAGMDHDPASFKRIASARTLYHWNADANQEY